MALNKPPWVRGEDPELFFDKTVLVTNIKTLRHGRVTSGMTVGIFGDGGSRSLPAFSRPFT